MNRLYLGDNLAILREHIADESVDLIYLDPPFNSNATYNVVVKSLTGRAQIEAFDDTWAWDDDAEQAFDEAIQGENRDVSGILRALRSFLKEGDMLAYLSMLAVRLLELHRALKPTGSLYLHCDPTASHYLKMVLDAVFGRGLILNEVIWRRTNAKGLAFRRFARNHDVILSYRKSDKWRWNSHFLAHDQEYTDKFYRHQDLDGRRYGLDNLLNPNKDRPNLTYEFLGVNRVWRWTRARMQKAFEDGLVVQSAPGGVPRFKRYLDEQEGTPIGDVWTDIRPIQSGAKEALGYPTQKPLALLERILAASSHAGDVVLDPFCGCGTSLHAAEKLDRRWVGVDSSPVAIGLVRRRLADAFPDARFEIIGAGRAPDGARAQRETAERQGCL